MDRNMSILEQEAIDQATNHLLFGSEFSKQLDSLTEDQKKDLVKLVRDNAINTVKLVKDRVSKL